MSIFNSKKTFFLIYKCIFLLSYLTYGSLAEGSELVVTGTASDTNGILPNSIMVTVDGVTTRQANYNEITGEWTATFEVGNGPHSVTASGYDNCSNSYMTPEKVVYVGVIRLNITDPADGSVSGTGGFPYVSCNVTSSKNVGGQSFVIAELPFEATFIDYSETGPSTFYVTVDSKDGDGAIRQADNQFAITSSAPTAGTILGTVSGYIEVSLPVNAGSDGLSQNVAIYASINNIAGVGPDTDTSTITVQLAHFGVDPIKNVLDTAGTFIINICAFIDPVNPFGLMGFDFDICADFVGGNTCIPWDTGVFTYNSAAVNSGAFSVPGYILSPPSEPFGAGSLRINNQSAPSPGPKGYLKLVDITFNRVGFAGSSDTLNIRLFDNAPSSFVDDINSPLPASRDQDGVVSIIPTPVPVVDQVCDSLAPAECNPAGVPFNSIQNIDIHGSEFDCANYTVNIPAFGFPGGNCDPVFNNPISCTDGTLIVRQIRLLGLSAACCDVSVTNLSTGQTSNICTDCLCVD